MSLVDGCNGQSALPHDTRFDFAWHVPASQKAGRPLLVAVHGSDRNWVETRDAFIPFARAYDLAILSPHFPPHLTSDGGSHGYKFLREPGIDYQRLTAAMMSEFAKRYAFDSKAIYLFGFSGGAQFALRYALLNPSKLRGAVIAAPGNVTLLDSDRPWWAGMSDVEGIFGEPIDIEALRRLPIRLLIGSDDRAEGRVVHREGKLYHSPHADHAGKDRQSCIKSLERSLRESGIPVKLEIVPGVGHDFDRIAPAAAIALGQMLAHAR